METEAETKVDFEHYVTATREIVNRSVTCSPSILPNSLAQRST